MVGFPKNPHEIARYIRPKKSTAKQMTRMSEFIVPDYYDHFHCKCGDCRKSCCRGWNISVSMREYYTLLSADASEDLRRRLDSALEIVSGDRERYAAFRRTEDGCCPLLAENGLCALQRECGEEPMPAVCRTYPRAIRTSPACELAFSASCEAVTELLFADTSPLGFIKRDLHPDADGSPSPDPRAERLMNNMRILCIRLLEDRALPLADRIAHMHLILHELCQYEERSDIKGLCDAAEELSARAFPLLRVPEADWIHLAAPLALAGAFIPESPSLSARWPRILEALHLPAERSEWTEEHFIRAERRYALLKGRFSDTHPHWQEHFERLLTNHAFYTRLPFSDRMSGLRDEALALAACYAMVRFASVVCAAEDPSAETLVDIVSAVMRLIEHSGFDRRCVALLRRSHFDDEEHLRDMLLTV